jgi:hypothetical protein
MMGWSKIEDFTLQRNGLLKVSDDLCAPMTIQDCIAEIVE